MVLRTLASLALVLLSTSISRAQTDSLDRYHGLDSLLTEFYTALQRESVEVKNAEFDALISSCQDSLTRQHVTLRILDHYMHSRVMGEEGVAIHIYDNWLKPGTVKTTSEFEMMDAELFANCNRRSLIGMQAEKITLRKPLGGRMTIPEDGRIAVLFFYDTACAKCRLEALALPSVLSSVDFPMNFYAVYVGYDKSQWRAFRRSFKLKDARNVRLVHLWDPEMDSDYQLIYGVTATPRMFITWKDGEILGRRLEVTNLQQIIDYIKIANGTQEK